MAAKPTDGLRDYNFEGIALLYKYKILASYLVDILLSGPQIIHYGMFRLTSELL